MLNRSPQQAEASRRNGAKSRGPRTPEGKQRSAANSLKHGLSASRALLDHEDKAEYDQHLDAYAVRFKPRDKVEYDLVKRMADATWRLERNHLLESVNINIAAATGAGRLEDRIVDPEPRGLFGQRFPHPR